MKLPTVQKLKPSDFSERPSLSNFINPTVLKLKYLNIWMDRQGLSPCAFSLCRSHNEYIQMRLTGKRTLHFSPCAL